MAKQEIGNSSLLALPGELRNMIYEYFFQDDDIKNLALLLTCKQVHDEASILAFAVTTFEVKLKKSYIPKGEPKEDWEYDEQIVIDVERWLDKVRALPELKRSAVKDLVVVNGDSHFRTNGFFFHKALHDAGLRPRRFLADRDQVNTPWSHDSHVLQHHRHYEIDDVSKSTLSTAFDLFTQNVRLLEINLRATEKGSRSKPPREWKITRGRKHPKDTGTTPLTHESYPQSYEIAIWWPNDPSVYGWAYEQRETGAIIYTDTNRRY